MRRLLCKSLLLIVVFSLLCSFLFAAELSETDRKKVYLMNEYTFYTTLVRKTANRLVLTNVYDHLNNAYSSKEIDEKFGEKLESMMDVITNLEINSLKRDRLEVIFDLQKSQAIASAIPNPGAVLGTFVTGSMGAASIAAGAATGNPAMVRTGTNMVISSVVSTVNIAASSITQYQAAKNANLISYLNDCWDLEYDEMRLVNKLNTDMFNQQNTLAHELSLEDKYVIKAGDMEAFVDKVQNSQNVAEKLHFLETHYLVYSEFPLYWLELANAYCEYEKYDKCYDTMKKYYELFSDYSSIFDKGKNIREGQVLVSVVYALLNINSDNPMQCKNEVLNALKRIEECTKDGDWLQKYFCAIVYMMYAEKGDDLYAKAMELFRNNAIELASKQDKLNQAYINDLKIASVSEKQSLTKAQREDLEQSEKEAKERRKTELPSFDSAFLENLKAYIALADKRTILEDDILRDNVQRALLLPQLYDTVFNEESDVSNQFGFESNLFSLDWHLTPLWKKTRSMTFKIPAVFLVSDSSISFSIKLGKNRGYDTLELSKDGSDFTYQVTKVERPSKSKYDVNNFIAIIEIYIPDSIDISADDYSIAINIDTGYCPITLFFSSTTGREEKIQFNYLNVDLESISDTTMFNMRSVLQSAK